MKRYRLIIAVAVALVLILAASCSLFTVSIDDRITRFMGDVNGDKASVYDNLSVDGQMYSQVKASSYWEYYFPSTSTYSLTGQSTSADTVSAYLSGGTLYSNTLITFTMAKNSNGDYVISRIVISGYSSPIYQ